MPNYEDMKTNQPNDLQEKEPSLVEKDQNLARQNEGEDLKGKSTPALKAEDPGNRFLLQKIQKVLERGVGISDIKVKHLVIGIVWLITVAIPTYFAFEEKFVPPKVFMDGEINIAVVGFDEIEGNVLSKDEENLIASVFYNRLDSDFSEFTASNKLLIQIVGPDDLRPISGSDSEKRKEAAERRAEKINADIVIYGTIKHNEGYLFVQPEFYVRLSNNYEIEDIVGDYPIGREIIIPYQGGVVGSQISANRELSNRADLLTLLTKGLSLYLVHAYEEAYEVFQQADEIKYWQNIEGKEIVYIFKGNAAGKSMYLDEAEAAYEKAVDLAPELSRGYIGLGNVYFLQYFQRQLDSKYLEMALNSFDQALKAEIQPKNAGIEAKAAFGKGQVYLTKWFLKEDTLDQAKTSFQYVIERYDHSQNLRLQEYAAEAFSRLALIEKYQDNPEGAIAHYQSAIKLAGNPSRKAIYFEQLADLYQENGNMAEVEVNQNAAIEEYLLAVSLSIQPERKAEYFEKISDLYLQLGEKTKAIHYLENAVELFPPGDPQREILKDKVDQINGPNGGGDDA